MTAARFVAVFASALLAVALADYVNQPIAPMTSNNELSTDGFTINRGGVSYQVPKGFGWCKDNAACGTVTNGTVSPLSSCYSTFYAPSGQTYNYAHCSAKNSAGFANNFNSYNMTYEARLFLLDLDVNGYDSIVTSGSDPVCAGNFSDFCFTTMWAHNIRAGFGCRQYGSNNVTYNNQQYQPPCQSFCYAIMNSACSAYPKSVLRGIETITQFCELFPTQNCISSASILPLSLMFVALSVVAAVFGALL